ncbi:major facilitator superfamily domain-containing protein [Xylariaceae sp. FL0594]|nr:major facilitator superfamily domain-containing protein [Xylariaceae sp. FL0594]
MANGTTAATANESTPLLEDSGRSVSDSFPSQSASSRSTAASSGAGPAAASGTPGEEDDDDDGDGLDVPNQKVTKKRAVAIILSVYVLIFLLAVNMSGITMAQSTIAEDLDSYENAMWFTTSFLVAASTTSPLMGKLSSIFSPRNMVLASSVLFAVGCAMTAQAKSFASFIAGRVVTGMGGGGTMILAFILVLELTTKRNRGLYIGLTNAGFTTGVSLGAVVFGAFIASTGWRTLFWIQAPVSLLAGCAIFFSIPSHLTSPGQQHDDDTPLGTKLKRLDYLGAFFLSATVVLFLFGLSANIQPIPLASSLGALVAFVLIEKYVSRDPIIPLAVLLNRGALLSCVAQLGLMAARWTVLFYAPVTALAVFGFNPAASGSILIPTNFGFGLGGLLVGAFHIRRAGSFWGPNLACIFLFGASLLGLAASSAPSSPFALYVAVVFLNGLFTGGALNYTLAHLLHLTPARAHYEATGLLGTFRGFAGSFGSAVGGGIFARTLRRSLEEGFEGKGRRGEELVRKLIGSPLSVYHGDLSEAEKRVAVAGYTDALRTLFQAAVVLTAIVIVVQAASGWEGAVDDDDADNGKAVDDGSSV